MNKLAWNYWSECTTT